MRSANFFTEGCFLCFQMPAGRTGSTQRTSKRGQGLFSSWRQSDLTLRHTSVNSRLGKGATPGTTAPLPCATEYKAVSWHHWNRPPRRLRCRHGEELLAAPGVSGATASDPPRGLLRRQTRLSLHASTARTTLRHHGGSPPHSAPPTFVPRRRPGLSFKPKPVTAFT